MRVSVARRAVSLFRLQWPANITGDDLGLPPGLQATILAAREASRGMLVRLFDGDGPPAMRELYRRWWQMESWMRLKPQTLVHITPQRGIKPTFRQWATLKSPGGGVPSPLHLDHAVNALIVESTAGQPDGRSGCALLVRAALHRDGLLCAFQQSHKLGELPNMIGGPGCDGGRRLERLVDAAEVVSARSGATRRRRGFDLLGEGVGQRAWRQGRLFS